MYSGHFKTYRYTKHTQLFAEDNKFAVKRERESAREEATILNNVFMKRIIKSARKSIAQHSGFRRGKGEEEEPFFSKVNSTAVV